MTTPLTAVKRHLLSWGTGAYDPRVSAVETRADAGPATVVLEDVDVLDAARSGGLVGPSTMVFVPADRAAGLHGVVAYEGSALAPGEELSVGDDFFLQIQDYGTSAFLSVIGPTLVRMFGEQDFDAYLTDADEARNGGRFPDFVVAPSVQLADMAGLGADHVLDGPALRMFVSRSGVVSTSPVGAPLGTVTDGFDQLAAMWEKLDTAACRPGAACLSAVVPDTKRALAFEARPWLGRYLAAAGAMRELHARGIAGCRVSGFGGRLLPALADADEPADERDPEIPVLLWANDVAHIHSPTARRTFEVSHEAAAVVEALLVGGSVDEAAAWVNRRAAADVARRFAGAGVALTTPDSGADR